jgi:hypothetical protein
MDRPIEALTRMNALRKLLRRFHSSAAKLQFLTVAGNGLVEMACDASLWLERLVACFDGDRCNLSAQVANAGRIGVTESRRHHGIGSLCLRVISV